jgi:hypothetical protein
MNTAIHEIAPEEIMAHHDGELSADRAQAVSTHLESCSECQHLTDSLQSTSQSVAGWKVDTAPASLAPLKARSFINRDSLDFSTFWHRLHNRRMAVALGLSVSAIAFLFMEIESPRDFRARPVAVDVTPLDIGDYVSKLPARKDRVGGGGGGGDRSSLLAGASNLSGKERDGGAPDDNGLLLGPLHVPRPGLALPHSPPPPPPSERQDDKATTTDLAMIARSAELQIVVKKFDDARTALQSVLARHHGYAASLHVGDPENAARTLNASLRIPSQELPAALNELKALGRVTNESQGGEEVTAEHADLVAQLKNSRETETRLQDILRNRTGKVSDVLEVEQEIARVRGEIEQAESELKSMDHRVAFATITLTLTEEYKAKVSDSSPSISTRFRNAAIAGYENVASSALGLILWFVEFFPPIIFWLVLLGAPAWWLWRRTQRALASVA